MVIFNSEISSVHIAQADLELTILQNQLLQELGIQVCAPDWAHFFCIFLEDLFMESGYQSCLSLSHQQFSLDLSSDDFPSL